MQYDRVVNWLYFIYEGIGCSEDHVAEVARAIYEEKKLDEHRTRTGRTVLSPIVIADDGDEDEDDTARLSDLIALVEAGLQAKEDEDDASRLSELIALVDQGLQMEVDTFISLATEVIDEVEAAYYRREADKGNACEPSHMKEAEDDTARLSELIALAEAGLQAEEDDDAFFTQAVEAADEAEAAYYRQKVDHGNACEPSHSNRVVVEDWYSDDELLIQYVSDRGFLIAAFC